MGAVSATTSLIKALSDSDVNVRCAVIRSLGDLRAESAFNNILSCLDDSDANVRIAALIALPQIVENADHFLLTKIEDLLQDLAIKVRMQAALTLAKFDFTDRAVSVLTEQLIHGEIANQLAALEMLGEIAKSNVKIQFDIQPILNALDHPSSSIRKAACQNSRIFQYRADSSNSY